MRKRLRPVLLVSSLLIGCAESQNPSFPVTVADANRVLYEARLHPRPLHRPLLIVGGFMDPGVGPLLLKLELGACFNDDRIAIVSLGSCTHFEQCRRRILKTVDRVFPEADEVDVIGLSLGGLAARYAASDLTGGRRLRIARLFTISSPHRGAVLADRLPLTLHPLQPDLRTNSQLVAKLNRPATQPTTEYPIYSYVRLNDQTVGAVNAALPGQTAWWVSAPLFTDAHALASVDARIVADIARRLRDEPPLTTDPPAPLPATEGAITLSMR